MPPGGDGYFYFSVFLWVRPNKAAYFDIEMNGELLCTAAADMNDYEMVSCDAITYAVEGIHRKI